MRHLKPFPNFTPREREDLLSKIRRGIFEVPPPVSRAHLVKGPCWLSASKWTDGRGYKKMRFKGHVFYVHRVLWQLMRGALPQYLLLDHLCRVRGCGNPDHLEPVTTKTNTERGDNSNWLMRVHAAHTVVLEDPFGPCEVLASLPWKETSTERYRYEPAAPLPVMDFAKVEERVITHLDGKIGDQPVVLETQRPEHWRNAVTGRAPTGLGLDWSTSDLLAIHIKHEHPRFRAPVGEAASPIVNPVGSELRHKVAPSRSPIKGPLPRHTVNLETGEAYIDYDFRAPPGSPSFGRRLLKLFFSLWSVADQRRVPPSARRTIGEL